MVKVATGIFLAAVCFGLVYLMGAFYSCSFDFSTWCQGARFGVAVVGGILALGALISAVDSNSHFTENPFD